MGGVDGPDRTVTEGDTRFTGGTVAAYAYDGDNNTFYESNVTETNPWIQVGRGEEERVSQSVVPVDFGWVGGDDLLMPALVCGVGSDYPTNIACVNLVMGCSRRQFFFHNLLYVQPRLLPHR